MFVTTKTNRTFFAVALCVLIGGCKKQAVVPAPYTATGPSIVIANIYSDASSITFDALSSLQINGFTALAAVGNGSKTYFITGRAEEEGATNASITFTEFSPVTDQSQQVGTNVSSIRFTGTKEQIIRVKWDDGQTADFTVNPRTYFSIAFPNGYQKIIAVWQEDRRSAIDGIKNIMTGANGLRVKAEKPVIQ